MMVLLAALVACAGTPFRWQDADRVRPGMTEAEVVAILGPPYARAQVGRRTRLVWSYANGFTGKTRAVGFELVDGRVAGDAETGRAGARPAASVPPAGGTGLVER